MATAKEEFILRICNLEKSLNSTAVKNKTLLPEHKEHNDIARMLRNGLTVVGFVALEDFIKKRSSEVVTQVGLANVPFSNLPEKLQDAATHEVVSALTFQIKLMNKADKIAYIQDHASKIASTANQSYELSEHIFGYNQSNISPDIIPKTLRSFNVDKPWRNMQKLASRLHLIGLPLDETFRSAAQRRHKAAHEASSDIPESDLLQFIKEAYAICISFDLLMTMALKQIQARNIKFLEGQEDVTENSIKLRKIKYIDRKWKEFSENNTRAIKVSNNKSEAITLARTRRNIASEALIEYNEDGKISNWSFD
jgi:hypothetical protein